MNPGVVSRRLTSAIVVGFVFCVVQPLAALAQQEEGARGVIEVNLGSREGESRSGVSVPVTLEASAGMNVGSVEMDISFPQKVLKFEGVVRGEAGASSDAQLKAEVEEGKDTSTLKLAISLPPGAGGRLPDGVVARLLFTIQADAEVGSSIVLQSKVRVWSTGDPAEQLKVTRAEAGRVDVTGITTGGIMACFFYQH